MSARATPDSEFAMALRQQRTSLELTQEQVAHAAGLTVAAYARIERGNATPTWTTVCALMEPLRLQLQITAGKPIYVGVVQLLERGA